MTTIPKCPECGDLLTVSLRVCRNCGWCAAPEPEPAPPPRVAEYLVPPSLPPMSRETMAKRISELQAIIKRAPERPGAVRRDPGGHWREVTKDHGRRCTCEICFPKRIAGSRYLRAAESLIETPRTNGFEQILTRHDALASMRIEDCNARWKEFAQQLERELAA